MSDPLDILTIPVPLTLIMRIAIAFSDMQDDGALNPDESLFEELLKVVVQNFLPSDVANNLNWNSRREEKRRETGRLQP